MSQALVASLRDELISDSSIRQQQEVEIILILFYTASSLATLHYWVGGLGFFGGLIGNLGLCLLSALSNTTIPTIGMWEQFFRFLLSPMPQCHNSRFKSLKHIQFNSGQLKQCKGIQMFNYHMTERTHVPRHLCLGAGGISLPSKCGSC